MPSVITGLMAFSKLIRITTSKLEVMLFKRHKLYRISSTTPLHIRELFLTLHLQIVLASNFVTAASATSNFPLSISVLFTCADHAVLYEILSSYYCSRTFKESFFDLAVNEFSFFLLIL
jgi:hypothetical protein